MATEIGTRIKRARERKRWSQQQLADALDVDRKTVDNWENGRTKPRSSIGAIEQALGISLDEDTQKPGLPTPAELDDLRDHIREVLGEKAGPFMDALDEAVSGAPRPMRRGRGAGTGRSSARRRAAPPS